MDSINRIDSKSARLNLPPKFAMPIQLGNTTAHPSHPAIRCWIAFACAFLAMPASSARCTDVATGKSLSLAEQIDSLTASQVTPEFAAPTAPEGLLLRRLSLDLRGMVPTREEIDAFLSDATSDRWGSWVDRFLSDPLCDEHLVSFLDRTLMLRRNFTHTDRTEWISFLREQVANDTPLDTFSRELLARPWWTQEGRVASRFYLDRLGDPHLVTRDLARVFLGRDLQCAQCHDHPLVEDFLQVDYHGLYAYVSSSALSEITFKDAEGKDQKLQLYVERAAGDAPYESVFEKGIKLLSGLRFPTSPETLISYVRPDQRYATSSPEGSLAGAPLPPAQSRRQQLAEQLTRRDHHEFVANWANRLWGLVFGQGLVHPLDMMHPDNPPANPELMEAITKGLVQSDMRMKPFLCQLVMSGTYHRAGEPELLTDATTDSTSLPPSATHIAERIQTLETEKQALTAAESTTSSAYADARTAWRAVQAERTTVCAELDPAEAALMEAKKKRDEAIAASAAAQKKLADAQQSISLLDEAATRIQESLTITGGENAELSQAITLTKQRADAARNQIPELEKQNVDAQGVVTTTTTIWDQAGTNVATVAAKLAPIYSALTAVDATLVFARSQWRAARMNLRRVERELASLTRAQDWYAEQRTLDSIAMSLRAANEQITNLQTEMDTYPKLIESTTAQMQTAQQSVDTIKRSQDQLKNAHNEQLAAITQLEKTTAALTDSLKLVAASAPVESARTSLQTELQSRQAKLDELQAEMDTVIAKLTEAELQVSQRQQEMASLTAKQTAVMEQRNRLETQRQALQTEQESVVSRRPEAANKICEDCINRLTAIGMTPLSPEQLGWSTLRVTGVLDAYIRTAAAELDKQTPLAADADEAMRMARVRQTVRQAIDKLRGNVDHYVSLYASGPDKTQDDFFASADQALYVANGGAVFNWAAPGNNNPTQVATTLTGPADVARVLYMSYLCRLPTADENAFVTEQLAAAGDQRPNVIQELAWSLLASSEFRFVQ
jgi:predicted nuclease with TOPRIM domain